MLFFKKIARKSYAPINTGLPVRRDLASRRATRSERTPLGNPRLQREPRYSADDPPRRNDTIVTAHPLLVTRKTPPIAQRNPDPSMTKKVDFSTKKRRSLSRDRIERHACSIARFASALNQPSSEALPVLNHRASEQKGRGMSKITAERCSKHTRGVLFSASRARGLMALDSPNLKQTTYRLAKQPTDRS